jgi:hypothetical protein
MSESRHRNRRRAVTLGLIVFLAGCTPSGGGCVPVEEPGGSPGTVDTTTTTTDPDDTTTTTNPDDTTTTTEAEETTTTTTATTLPGGGDDGVRVEQLELEDCFSPTNADTFVDRVRIIDCDTPHSMEVFAQYELDQDATYPGGNELTWAAKDDCRDRFDEYVGQSYWDSEFDLKVLIPSFSTWDVGDRTITCLIVDPSGDLLDGPAKGAGR